MAKSLSMRIAERMSKKAASVGGQNRAAFLALKPDIEEALGDRWPVKSIWETLYAEGKIRFSYQSFRKYANTLIPPLNEPGAPGAPTSTAAPIPAASKPTKREKPGLPTPQDKHPKAEAPPARDHASTPEPDGFQYNPNPNTEDYL